MKQKLANINEREDRRMFLHPYTFLLEEQKKDKEGPVLYNLRLIVGGRPQLIPAEPPCYMSSKRMPINSKETRK